ncbi:MAG: SulP family inorganic anion transporter [Bacteroidia bacterium]
MNLNKQFSLKNLMPILSWLPKYDKAFLSWDIIAGITLASFVLPESMAYATIAGVPPQYGIYCCLAGGFLFAFFTTTKQVVVGPTSALSLMVGTTIAVLSGGDLQRWVEIASLTALAVALLCFIAYALKLSSLINFISHNVLLGFKAGAAFSIAATQLPKLFGVHGGGANFFLKMQTLIEHLPETNLYVFGFGCIALVALIGGNKLFPGRPVSLIIVIASILVVTFTEVSQYGFHVVGKIPGGLLQLGRPSLRFNDVEGVFALALGCFLMGYIETIAVSRTYAEKNKHKIQPRQELLSLGFANLASAFSGGYVVSGGLSQSTVNDKAGAKTPLSLVICSAVLAIMLLFFTGLLENMPEVILAVVVLVAIAGLVKVKELKRLYTLSKIEFAIAMVAFAGVLLFGILNGVLIASFVSILLLIVRASNPTVALLGKVPGTNMFSDIERHPDNELIKGCMILRVEASIIYFNEESVYDAITQKIEQSTDTIKLVILDMSSTPRIDVAASQMLMNLLHELKEKGITLRIVDTLSDVRELLRLQGMEDITGKISRRVSVHDVIAEFQSDLT